MTQIMGQPCEFQVEATDSARTEGPSDTVIGHGCEDRRAQRRGKVQSGGPKTAGGGHRRNTHAMKVQAANHFAMSDHDRWRP
jgi:hypothetical protein